MIVNDFHTYICMCGCNTLLAVTIKWNANCTVQMCNHHVAYILRKIILININYFVKICFLFIYLFIQSIKPLIAACDTSIGIINKIQ